MKKQIIVLLLSALLIIGILPMSIFAVDEASQGIWDGNAADGFYSGTGNEDAPYIIMTAAQLKYFANQVNGGNLFLNKYIELGADIVLNDTTEWENWDDNTAPTNAWTPIGNIEGSFKGKFNGNGFTVSGIYVCTTGDFAGLFGSIQNATVKSINIEKSYIQGCSYVGGIAGRSNNGKIINCCNMGTVVSMQSSTIAYVGGIVGNGYNGTVSDCCNMGTVQGMSMLDAVYVGGIVGNNNDGIISGCYNTGEISGTVAGEFLNTGVGGIAGSNSGMVANSYNTGNISGFSTFGDAYAYVGGVVGMSNGTIINCYSTGIVNDKIGVYLSAGIVVGKSSAGTVTNCYYLNTVAASEYGTALNETEMKLQESFVGFDFDEVWSISENENNGYPMLKHFVFSMEILGASIRTEEPYGFRFAVRVKDNSPKEIEGYGVLLLPADLLGESEELTVSTSSVLNITAKVFFEKGNPDYVDGAHTFTGVLLDIPEGAWEWEISARGYVKYKDGSYEYTDTITRTYIGVAKACYFSQSEETKAALESIFGVGFAFGTTAGDDNIRPWKWN